MLTGLQSQYGKGKGTYKGKPTPGNELEVLMGTERNPELLKEMWVSWHNNVGRPMADDYAQFVTLANTGAKELGYADLGAMWRSGYDMPPEEFAALTDRLWGQVKPLYDQLHCYVRSELSEKYGPSVQPATGPIRADLLGNMWAQSWGNIYAIVAPPGAGDIGFDLTELLVARKYTPEKIVKTGESFFSSLGFAPLPQSFWERSMITKPEGREVVCHASAWDLDNLDDIRIKMCTKVNADDFVTVHHELGHNYYQRAYKDQPYLYKDSANDGFHEAIGDMIALSVTPEYLTQIGLLSKSKVPPPSKDIGLLLLQAMDKVAFLPFGLLVDRWRWGVFSGETSPAEYNQAWTDLRLRYQGVTPPVARAGHGLRSGRQIPHPGQHALHALLPGRDPAGPILRSRVPSGRLDRPASPLLVLQQSGGRAAAQCDAGDGQVEALAGRAAGLHRQPRNVGRADDPLLCAAAGVASAAQRRQAVRLVRR